MQQQPASSWPVPPPRIAAKWPDGFPEDGSEEFNRIAYGWGLAGCRYLSTYLGRELSTIDRYEIVRHAQDILRQYFSGNYELGPFEEMFTRYLDNLFGFLPYEAEQMIGGNHRGAARAHPESPASIARAGAPRVTRRHGSRVVRGSTVPADGSPGAHCRLHVNPSHFRSRLLMRSSALSIFAYLPAHAQVRISMRRIGAAGSA